MAQVAWGTGPADSTPIGWSCPGLWHHLTPKKAQCRCGSCCHWAHSGVGQDAAGGEQWLWGSESKAGGGEERPPSGVWGGSVGKWRYCQSSDWSSPHPGTLLRLGLLLCKMGTVMQLMSVTIYGVLTQGEYVITQGSISLLGPWGAGCPFLQPMEQLGQCGEHSSLAGVPTWLRTY